MGLTESKTVISIETEPAIQSAQQQVVAAIMPVSLMLGAGKSVHMLICCLLF